TTSIFTAFTNSSFKKPTYDASASDTVLMTIKTSIRNPDQPDRCVEAYVFFDPGSEESYISSKLSQYLGVRTIDTDNISLFTFGSERPQTRESSIVEINI
uniref:Peptidase aspartic putative domain-containing protein n=1 Tax=Acrobeloides nanus TaxID=290746 RepID=A0A914DKR4_9BILA